MKSVFASAAAVAAFALLGPACSSSESAAPYDPLAPVTSCDSAKCAAGNTCQKLDGDLKCRKSCTSNVDPSGSCPDGYTCVGTNEPTQLPAAGCAKIENDKTTCAALVTSTGTRLFPYTCTDTKPLKGCTGIGDGATFCCNDEAPETLAAPLCVKNFATSTPGPKQWGTACNPQEGQANNAACDLAQGFNCFANSPTDGAAYCTRFDCTADRECGPGFGCTTVNLQPNAIRTARSFHEVRSVCARRAYGSACTADVDCGPIGGLPAHCIADDKGAGFCTPECQATANCNVDASCKDINGDGIKVCYPRAGVIVGDGALCSPCHNDNDCGDDGLCVKGSYTTERFCAKKATACSATETKCPASAKAGADIRCQVPDEKNPSPTDSYCFGLYALGERNDLGCWTPNRSE